MAQLLVAITGGIGSGKSVVSHIVSTMGYGVYDTDANAKRLMNVSNCIRKSLINHFGPQVYTSDGVLDRAYLASVVFGNQAQLLFLNSVVHPAVATDVMDWAEKQRGKVTFVETALLHASGLAAKVDAVWRVTAPEDVRVARVMKRNGITAQAVRDRIKAQQTEEVPFGGEQVVVNDGCCALLPQVVELLKKCGA